MNRHSLLVVSFLAPLLVTYAINPGAAMKSPIANITITTKTPVLTQTSISTPMPTETPTPTQTLTSTQTPTKTPDWMIGFLTATSLTIIGWVLTLIQRRVSKKEEQREAVAALRFELESNLGWIEDIFDRHNYLRDDAWVILKNKGYISYLPKPIPMKVIKVYNQLFRLNKLIDVLKNTAQEADRNFDYLEAGAQKSLLRESIEELIALLDAEYPKIGENFQEA